MCRHILSAFRVVVPVSNRWGSVQVNIPAESGVMGVLANHVPSIEQLKPGIVEIIEEQGGSKEFFSMRSYFFTFHNSGLKAV